jgi:peptidoglycan hydrolase CwlO-like protein
MDQAQIFEHLFRAVLTAGVGAVIYNLREFKTDFKKLTERLSDVSYGLQSVVETSKHRDEKIAELKKQIDVNEAAIHNLRERILRLELGRD